MNVNIIKNMKKIITLKDKFKKQEEWDIFYLKLAKEISKQSKCLSRQIGAVIVKNNSVISIGYNGAPRGVFHCQERPIDFFNDIEKKYSDKTSQETHITECPRRLYGYKSGEGLHLCPAQHAEENAITNATRNGVSCFGATMYAFCGEVCKNCAGTIINSGIKELVYLRSEKEYDNYSKVLLTESGIVVRTIDKELLQ
jgi:dCMP deaminase